MHFTCATCGQLHDADEISFGANAPVQWELVSEEERSNSELGEELCVLTTNGQVHYFLRACLEIPIQDSDRPFTWGVWVSLSDKSFLEISEHWEDPLRTKFGPYFGWLCTRIPEYPDTVFLKTHVHQRSIGLRPTIELEETDHPLSAHQRNGIEAERLREIIVKVLHT